MTDHSPTTAWRAELAWYLAITAATGVAFGVGGSPVAGLAAGGGMLAFTLALAFGRRRVDALRVAGGAGDERNRELYVRSLAVAGGVVGLVTTGWFLATVAAGRVDGPLAVLTALFAVSFLAASAYTAATG